jgi:hypothetical protein
MPRMRNRTEPCPYCNARREITVNLDTNQPTQAEIPGECIRNHQACVEEMRDKALLAPFADGKARLR